MNNSDPWKHILDQFFDLHSCRAKLLPDNIVTVDGYQFDMFKWIDNTLNNWEDVTLVGAHSWQFKNKRTAEKFITLFNLKWAK